MVLENMVDADSVDDELEGEVADECAKFGRVTRVTVTVSSNEQDDDDKYELPADTADSVKIFVEFSLQSGKLIRKWSHVSWTCSLFSFSCVYSK